jgi:hypothetical protein
MNTKGVLHGTCVSLLLALTQLSQLNANAAGPFLLSTELLSAWNGGAAWGDYDNDGDLDLLISAEIPGSSTNLTQIWHNEGNGTFSFINFNPSPIAGPVAWGDLDNDGYLDLIITGTLGPGTNVTEIWQNLGGTNFLRIPNILPANNRGTISVADFDNDGRADIAISSQAGSTNRIYRNLGAFGFSDVNTPGFPNSGAGLVQFGDMDGDGWMDLVVAGGGFGHLYRNLNGTALTNILDLSGVGGTRGEFADYNHDGRLDLFIARPGANPSAQVWFNYGTGLVESGIVFPSPLNGAAAAAAAWGDYDNDGWPDIYLSWSKSASAPSVFRNNGDSSFSAITADFNTAIYDLPVVFGIWGDCNNDGKLDLFISEFEGEAGVPRYSLYTNNIPTSNAPPSVPGGLTYELAVGGSNVVLRWLAASDAETPSASLSYNVRVGTTPGACDIVSPMADPTTGARRIPALGNAQLRRFSVLSQLEKGRTYYWSVQAIDSGFVGGAWAPEATFTTVKVPGDTNNDGIVSQDELDHVLAHYWPTSPWLAMTNASGLGDTNVQFTLTGYNAWNFTVEYSTNLMDWNVLGPTAPVYQFNDPANAGTPTRYYRLRWP